MLFLNYCILLVVFPVVHAHVLFVSLDSLFSFSLHHAERVKPGLIWKWRSASVRTCLGPQPHMLMYFITTWRNIGSFDWSPAGGTVCCAGVCDSRLEVWVSFQRKVSLSGQRKAINTLPSLPLNNNKKKKVPGTTLLRSDALNSAADSVHPYKLDVQAMPLVLRP